MNTTVHTNVRSPFNIFRINIHNILAGCSHSPTAFPAHKLIHGVAAIVNLKTRILFQYRPAVIAREGKSIERKSPHLATSSTRSPNPLPAFGGRSLTFRQQIWRSEPECRLAFAAESTDRLPHPSCLGIAPQARHQIQRDPSHRDRRPPSLARAPNARQL